MSNLKPADKRRDFPLAALFVLVAFVAVCIALVRANMTLIIDPSLERYETAAGTGAFLLCIATGALVGVTTGIQYFRRVRGFLLGLFLGIATGGFAGFLLIAGRAIYPLTLGIVLLFLTALVFWFTSNRRRAPE